MAGMPQASDTTDLPGQLAIIPFRNRVLLPGGIVRIRCTSASSVRLIEQELWQKEESGVIGVVPVRDSQLDGLKGASVLQLPSSLVGPGGGGGPANGLDELEGLAGKDGGSLVADSMRPQRLDWHDKGVAAQALHLSRGLEKPGGKVTYTVVLEGRCRFAVNEMTARGPYLVAFVSQLDMTKTDNDALLRDAEVAMAAKQFKAIAQEFLSILEQKRGMVGRTRALTQSVPAHRLADLLVATLDGSFEGRLAMLDAVDLKQRLMRATDLVAGHLQSIRITESIHKRVEDKLSKTQRDFLLRQQMKVIKEELGDNEDDDDDVAGLQRKMEAARMPPNVWKQAQRELRRLRKMSPQQPGYGSSRQYLELLADLPWSTSSEEKDINLDTAREALDKEHFGLGKVKRRIIEYLAVQKLKPDVRGPVLCFIGAPGVGKTSLGSSIAKALDRKFVRISLGGVKDEADIRGHRRTYIGSLPGRLIEGIKRAGVNNPVMLLDEIDKTGMDARGDPAAALLEVLDPEQNRAFNDHYLGVPFDLSKVVFVATANRSSPIPPALRDRMEMIEIPGYTPEEKRRIAMQHLIPRALEQHGISPWQLQIPEETVEILISRYTREAGVRNLDRNLAALCRAEAVRVAEARTRMQQMEKDIQPSTAALMQGVVGGVGGGGDMEVEVEAAAMASGLQGKNVAATVSIDIEPIVVDEALLEIILGPPKFDGTEAAERVSTPGVAVGLVWTAVGGEVQFVEASTMSGKGELQLTGQLGDVIKESAKIALTWVRARVAELSLMVGAEDNLMDGRDVHIHFPAGAVPKDGPSAGITLITALVSLLSKRSARADTAMTGEVTLRGLVLPVGGVKEKVLAAHRYGIKRVILPHRNVKDLQDVPAEIVAHMEVLPVKNVEEALHHAFEGGCPVLPKSKL